ncbi:unnamed protein product [Lactuca saligna]|uniref:Uncharacterized protein n=1 Tax=Lactuca saligna TaxID=75948 RepID=A0AA35ZKL9_LACSI|nr:unnamed protein product [Lactuca saligna]
MVISISGFESEGSGVSDLIEECDGGEEAEVPACCFRSFSSFFSFLAVLSIYGSKIRSLWERLLAADFPTCPLLTRELLATLSEVNKEGNFAFHYFSTLHSIHVDQLCTFFHTPITNMSQPTAAFNIRDFWHSIIGLDHYEASQSVKTNIVHPVLKTALKIICNIIYTFHRVINLNTDGAIRCGDPITLITRAIAEQVPPEYTFFSGPDVIACAEPISETEWVLPLNIPPPLRPRRSQQTPARLYLDRPSSSTVNRDYTDATLLRAVHHRVSDIAALQQNMTRLRLNYQLYSTQVSGFCDEVLGYREDFTDFYDEFFYHFPSFPE